MTARVTTYTHSDGMEYWWRDGKWHRLDGPAYTHPTNGAGDWYNEDWYWPRQHREWWTHLTPPSFSAI